jgi:hypothetical protein
MKINGSYRYESRFFEGKWNTNIKIWSAMLLRIIRFASVKIMAYKQMYGNG